MRTFTFLMVMCSLALHTPAIAAGEPAAAPAPAAPIVVTGTLKQTLSNFVFLLTQSGPTDQVARWKEEVCPEIYGIDPDQAQFMKDRIGSVAKDVHLRVGDSDCPATLAIIVTPDASGFAAELESLYPISLRTDGRGRLKRFLASTKPVRWISVTDECGAGCSLPNSRIVRATKPALTAVIVVVDAAQIAGVKLGELSDYVSLVALSNPPADNQPPADSILSLFDRRPDGPRELTKNDLAFLSALYRVRLDQGIQTQRTIIANQMQRSVEGKTRPAHKPQGR